MKNYTLTVMLALAVVLGALTVRRGVVGVSGPGFSAGPMMAIGVSPMPPLPPRPVNIGVSPMPPLPPRPVQ